MPEKPASGPATDVRRGRWRTLSALASGYFIDQGEGQAMSVLFPAIRDALNFGYGGLGQIAGWRNLLQALSAPVWGFVADRTSRKWVIVFGTGLWGLWTLACGFVTSYEQLFWVRIIAGLGLGCLLLPTFSIISDLFGPEERGRANGFLGSAGFVGVIVSVVVLGWMLGVPGLGWRWGFYVLGCRRCRLSGPAGWPKPTACNRPCWSACRLPGFCCFCAGSATMSPIRATRPACALRWPTAASN
jgi:MFS family permease